MGNNRFEVTTNLTKGLASFIKNLKYEDIPPAVIEKAKMMVMQTCGVCICGAELKQMQDYIDVAKEMSPGADGKATLWADGKKVSWEAAVMVAGGMADMLDWEDCSSTGHPSATVIPMAVVTSEVMHCSGKEMLTAIVAGYEVYQRMAFAAGTNIHSPNIFGAIAVLGKLLKMSEEDINKAIGVGAASATISAGVHENTMSDSMNYIYGYRTESCVAMVKTVLNGIKNMEDALDIPSAYFLHCNFMKLDKVLEGLGEKWLMVGDLLVKHWPANVFVQTYAELASRLATKYKFNPDDIAEIIIKPSVMNRHFSNPNGYKSPTQAQFSIPYGTACAMYHPVPGAHWYKPETMADPRIAALMMKIKTEGFTEQMAPFGIKAMIDGYHPEKFMTVIMNDGTKYVESAFTHPGHPNYMLTRDEFKDRFRLETKNMLSPEKIEGAIDCICHLDEYEDASVLPSFFY